MKCGCLATRAELLELKAVWVVSAVLFSDVVALFTVDAGHGDLWTYVRALACHGLAPFYMSLCQLYARASGYLTTMLVVKLRAAELVAEAGFEPATQRL